MQTLGIMMMVIGLLGLGFTVGRQWERTKR